MRVELLDAFALKRGDDVVVVDADGVQLFEYLLGSLEFRLEPAVRRGRGLEKRRSSPRASS